MVDFFMIIILACYLLVQVSRLVTIYNRITIRHSYIKTYFFDHIYYS